MVWTLICPSFPSCLCMYLFWWHVKSERVSGWFSSAPSLCGMCSSWCIGGVRRRKRERQGWDGTQADMIIMLSLLYYLSPWRPRALCAVCVRSPRRSCLCSWTAADSGVYSKIHPEELRRCQGCKEERNGTVIYKRNRIQEKKVNTRENSKL